MLKNPPAIPRDPVIPIIPQVPDSDGLSYTLAVSTQKQEAVSAWVTTNGESAEPVLIYFRRVKELVGSWFTEQLYSVQELLGPN